MKTQLLIALTCSSLAFADRGDDFSNGKAKSKEGNDFSNGASGSGGYSFQSLLEGSANTVNLQPPEAIG